MGAFVGNFLANLFAAKRIKREAEERQQNDEVMRALYTSIFPSAEHDQQRGLHDAHALMGKIGGGAYKQHAPFILNVLHGIANTVAEGYGYIPGMPKQNSSLIPIDPSQEVEPQIGQRIPPIVPGAGLQPLQQPGVAPQPGAQPQPAGAPEPGAQPPAAGFPGAGATPASLTADNGQQAPAFQVPGSAMLGLTPGLPRLGAPLTLSAGLPGPQPARMAARGGGSFAPQQPGARPQVPGPAAGTPPALPGASTPPAKLAAAGPTGVSPQSLLTGKTFMGHPVSAKFDPNDPNAMQPISATAMFNADMAVRARHGELGPEAQNVQQHIDTLIMAYQRGEFTFPELQDLVKQAVTAQYAGGGGTMQTRYYKADDGSIHIVHASSKSGEMTDDKNNPITAADMAGWQEIPKPTGEKMRLISIDATDGGLQRYLKQSNSTFDPSSLPEGSKVQIWQAYGGSEKPHFIGDAMKAPLDARAQNVIERRLSNAFQKGYGVVNPETHKVEPMNKQLADQISSRIFIGTNENLLATRMQKADVTALRYNIPIDQTAQTPVSSMIPSNVVPLKGQEQYQVTDDSVDRMVKESSAPSGVDIGATVGGDQQTGGTPPAPPGGGKDWPLGGVSPNGVPAPPAPTPEPGAPPAPPAAGTPPPAPPRQAGAPPAPPAPSREAGAPPAKPAPGQAAARATPNDLTYINAYIDSQTGDSAKADPAQVDAGRKLMPIYYQKNGWNPGDIGKDVTMFATQRKALREQEQATQEMGRFVNALDEFSRQFIAAARRIPDVKNKLEGKTLREIIQLVKNNPDLSSFSIAANSLRRSWTAITSNAYRSKGMLQEGSLGRAAEAIDTDLPFTNLGQMTSRILLESKTERWSFAKAEYDNNKKMSDSRIGQLLGETPPELPPKPDVHPAPADGTPIRGTVKGVMKDFKWDALKGEEGGWVPADQWGK